MDIRLWQTSQSCENLICADQSKSLSERFVLGKFSGNTSTNNRACATVSLKSAFRDLFIFHFYKHFHGIATRSLHFCMPIWIFDLSEVSWILSVIDDCFRILFSNLFHDLVLEFASEFFKILIFFHFFLCFQKNIMHSGIDRLERASMTLPQS